MQSARPTALPVVAVTLLLAACAEEIRDPIAAPLTTIQAAIVDAAHGGAPGFYFLPPMVNNPRPTGSFDDRLLDHIRVLVCGWNHTTCMEPSVEFTARGTGSTRVRLGGDHYIVNWHTGGPGTYRVFVLAGDVALGHADVRLVSRGNELRNVPADVVGAVAGQTLPIKFRIERGAVTVLGAAGGNVSGLDGRVTLDVPPDALTSDAVIAIIPVSGLPAGPGAAVGPQFELRPANLTFAVPVTLTVNVGAVVSDPGDPTMAALFHLFGGAWQEVLSDYDETSGTVTFTLTRFTLVPVVQPDPDQDPGSGENQIGVSGKSLSPPTLSMPSVWSPFALSAQKRSCIPGLSLSPLTAFLFAGDAFTYRLTYPGRLSLIQLNNLDATWLVGGNVGTISGAGRFQATNAGSAKVTVWYPKNPSSFCLRQFVTASVTVLLRPVANVTVSPATATIATGETASFSATLTAANGAVLTGRTVTWSSANNNIATVNGSGVATGVAAGTVQIRATSEGKTGFALLTVDDPQPGPNGTVVATAPLIENFDLAVANNGVVYVAWCEDINNGHGNLKIARSTNGVTWQPRGTVNAFHCGNYPSIALDNAGVLYVSGDGGFNGYVKRSSDGGLTFGAAETMPIANFIIQGLAVSGAGDVYVVGRDQNEWPTTVKLWLMTSIGGAAFSARSLISQGLASAFPAVAVQPANGTVHVAWREGSCPFCTVLQAQSADAGLTWSAARVVSPQTAEVPAITAANGQVLITWGQFAGFGQPQQFYAAGSTNDGASFAASFQIPGTGLQSQRRGIAGGGSRFAAVSTIGQEVWLSTTSGNVLSWNAPVQISQSMSELRSFDVATNGTRTCIGWLPQFTPRELRVKCQQ